MQAAHYSGITARKDAIACPADRLPRKSNRRKNRRRAARRAFCQHREAIGGARRIGKCVGNGNLLFGEPPLIRRRITPADCAVGSSGYSPRE